MNCKPGDLAIVLALNPKYSGMLVEVLFAPPPHDFLLPDGYRAAGAHKPGLWVIKSLGAPFEAPVEINGGQFTRRTQFAVGADRWLKPIRGDEQNDETPTEVKPPEPVAA